MARRDVGVFAISVAAEMTSLQIQNLRVYERRGLVSPERTAGGTRRYSADDVTRLVRSGEAVERLLSEDATREAMGKRARARGKPDAAAEIVSNLLTLIA